MSSLRKADESFDRRKGIAAQWFHGQLVPLDVLVVYRAIYAVYQAELMPIRYEDIESWLADISLCFGKNKLTACVERLIELGLVLKAPRRHTSIRVSNLAYEPPTLEQLLAPHWQMEVA